MASRLPGHKSDYDVTIESAQHIFFVKLTGQKLLILAKICVSTAGAELVIFAPGVSPERVDLGRRPCVDTYEFQTSWLTIGSFDATWIVKLMC